MANKKAAIPSVQSDTVIVLTPAMYLKNAKGNLSAAIRAKAADLNVERAKDAKWAGETRRYSYFEIGRFFNKRPQHARGVLTYELKKS